MRAIAAREKCVCLWALNETRTQTDRERSCPHYRYRSAETALECNCWRASERERGRVSPLNQLQIRYPSGARELFGAVMAIFQLEHFRCAARCLADRSGSRSAPSPTPGAAPLKRRTVFSPDRRLSVGEGPQREREREQIKYYYSRRLRGSASLTTDSPRSGRRANTAHIWQLAPRESDSSRAQAAQLAMVSAVERLATHD